MRTEYVEAVLELVALIPAGTAVAYGDVAELLGSGGPRQVGSVMSHYGSSVPWWRVLKASGRRPAGPGARGLGQFYLQEGTPLLGRLRRTSAGPARGAGALTWPPAGGRPPTPISTGSMPSPSGSSGESHKLSVPG